MTEKHNPRNAGRKPKFKTEFGRAKRIMISVPEFKQLEVKAKVDEMIRPYINEPNVK